MKKTLATSIALASMLLASNAFAGGQVGKTDISLEFINTAFSDSVGNSTLGGTGVRATYYATNTIAVTGGFHSLSDSRLDASGYDIGIIHNNNWSADDTWYFSAMLGYGSDDIGLSSGGGTVAYSGFKGGFMFSYLPTKNIKVGAELNGGLLSNSVTSLTTAVSVSYSF